MNVISAWRGFLHEILCMKFVEFSFSFFHLYQNCFSFQHQEATQHTGEGIIENLETEVV